MRQSPVVVLLVLALAAVLGAFFFGSWLAGLFVGLCVIVAATLLKL